ncbi:hypothetical protein QR680_017849 [Steinernema hermaphroditum]|uniref:Sulfite oxidase n=1 Tax=Steinernema hermaphroditum TaxID=289476 RepID=A0AA39LQ48_9BILA|nr:hypothetical protein QR680_017849 [Steinernema hermaphroditum]
MHPSRGVLLTRRILSRRFDRSSVASFASSGSSSDGNESKRINLFPALLSASVVAGAGFFVWKRGFGVRVAFADARPPPKDVDSFVPPKRADLPTFSKDEIKKHGRSAERIWVTFKNGVYDITEFLESHPGGDKILMAAGGSVEPFWALYAQHKTEEVMEILEELRIGNVDPKDMQAEAKSKDLSDPFHNDPIRHPALLVNSQKPFNAESPASLLLDSFRTPNDLFFVRNHLPVPEIKIAEHKLTVEGVGIPKPITLDVEQLKKKFKKASVTSVIQCAGNRRADMNEYKKVQGLMWTGTAISNAKWSGVPLRDILIDAGVDPNSKEIKHVHFEGADIDPTGKPYGASIPFAKAMSEEVLVAYEMNDEPIPRDHGFPLRLVCPGNVGARQVKWLACIRTSDVESPSHWQQKDYRAFSPAVGFGDHMDFQSVPSIQEYPVQSAFCTPVPNASVDRSDETIDVAGYAWSGGGRGIIRVEVSPDGGKTWFSAELEHDSEQDLEQMWAWTLWRASIKIPEELQELDLVCKATDRAYNTQPETASGIWNVRGLLHNAWHRVKVKVNEA